MRISSEILRAQDDNAPLLDRSERTERFERIDIADMARSRLRPYMDESEFARRIECSEERRAR
jgi:hypothetical protein